MPAKRRKTEGKRPKSGTSGWHRRPKVPPPDSSVWPEEYRGDRWKPIYAFFFAGKCQLCAYSFAKPKWRRDMDKCDGVTRMILCTNHPRTPGELREVLPTETCRNFKPKAWQPAKPKRTRRTAAPLGDQSDPTICRIPLGNGLFATVDAADYRMLSRYKWRAAHRGSNTYAVCTTPKGRIVSMHRMLLHPRKGWLVDHIDGNGLNNRRGNLRICDHQQNAGNRVPCGRSSRFVGVCRVGDKYLARITYRGKSYHLGTFTNEIDAAKARDQKAYELWGPYAYLNFPEDYPRPAHGRQKTRNTKSETRNKLKARSPRKKGFSKSSIINRKSSIQRGRRSEVRKRVKKTPTRAQPPRTRSSRRRPGRSPGRARRKSR